MPAGDLQTVPSMEEESGERLGDASIISQPCALNDVAAVIFDGDGVLVDSGHGTRPKPDPQPFLIATEEGQR